MASATVSCVATTDTLNIYVNFQRICTDRHEEVLVDTALVEAIHGDSVLFILTHLCKTLNMRLFFSDGYE